MERVIVAIAVLIAISLIATASAVPGTATPYTPILPSACYGFQDPGTSVAALSRSLFNTTSACGRRYRLRCVSCSNSAPTCRTSDVIIVQVVDLCVTCGPNEFQISREAFSRLCGPDIVGPIQIDYVQA